MGSASRRFQRGLVRVVFCAWVACVVAPSAREAHAEGDGFALLAVGDGGAPPDDRDGHQTQRAVAAAMAASDRERPVDALLLLGDNFYPDGLLRSELALRARENLARPFCRFLEIAALHAAELGDACGDAAGERHAVPVFALLGNHDTRAPESPDLQRTTLREYFSNWRMPAGTAAVHELAGGVSLVVVNSTGLFEGADVAPLIVALHAAQGPWRILATHQPFANRDRGSEAARHERYRRVVLEAIAAAGVTVHLVLSAHEHNLQLLRMDPPAPTLHAIAGGGSGARSLHGSDPHREAGFEEPGFARVDIAGAGDAARLTLQLYGLPRGPFAFLAEGPRLLAGRSVGLDGRARTD